MPEAGRRVKCSETHQHFPSHLLSSHADSLQKNPYPTQIYLWFIFFCIFFFFASLWPSCKGYLGERSSPCSTLWPTYQVSKHFHQDVLCYSENIVLLIYMVRLHSHVVTEWFHPYLAQLLLQAPRASKAALQWDLQMNFSCMSLTQYQFHSISITH